MRVPSSTSPGILTDSLRRLRARPSPLHIRHGSAMTSPLPRQVGQPRSTTKKPCCARTLPAPPHEPQVRAQSDEFVQPRPRQVSHCELVSMVMLDLEPGECLLERQLEVVAQVGAARRVRAARTRVHEIAEDRREDVGEAVEPALSERVLGAAVLERGLAEPVVRRAFLRILEHVIGFVDRLEARLLVAAAVVPVGVMFLGQPAVGGLDGRGSAVRGTPADRNSPARPSIAPGTRGRYRRFSRHRDQPFCCSSSTSENSASTTSSSVGGREVPASGRPRLRSRLLRLVHSLAELHRRLGERVGLSRSSARHRRFRSRSSLRRSRFRSPT